MMPEGPEVSSFVYNLNNDLFPPSYSPSPSSTAIPINDSTKMNHEFQYHLTDFHIISGRYTKAPPTGYEGMKSRLPIALHSIQSKGKFIYFNFKDGFSIWSTLGLQGHWILFPDKQPVTKRDNLRLVMKFNRLNDYNQFYLAYYDTIGYGTIKICTSETELEEKLKSLGPCWVHNTISLQEFISLIKKAKSDRFVAVFLMDQSKTAGIGNYVLAEAFYMSRLFPWIKCGHLAQSEESMKSLYDSIRTIIQSSYASQILNNNIKKDKEDDDEKYAFIEEGQFEFKCYGRDYCPLGHPVVKELGPHKRSIHWVPHVQIDTSSLS